MQNFDAWTWGTLDLQPGSPSQLINIWICSSWSLVMWIYKHLHSDSQRFMGWILWGSKFQFNKKGTAAMTATVCTMPAPIASTFPAPLSTLFWQTAIREDPSSMSVHWRFSRAGPADSHPHWCFGSTWFYILDWTFRSSLIYRNWYNNQNIRS